MTEPIIMGDIPLPKNDLYLMLAGVSVVVAVAASIYVMMRERQAGELQEVLEAAEVGKRRLTSRIEQLESAIANLAPDNGPETPSL